MSLIDDSRAGSYRCATVIEGQFGEISPADGLLERGDELGRLDQVAAACARGRGAVMLVEGEAGIGKTALLAAAAALASERGCKVLGASGGELEGEFAFGVVRQLLEREVQGSGRSRRSRLLLGAARMSMPIVAPARSTVGETLASPDVGAVQHGLYWLVANLADEQPLMLVIDDLHWADAPTIRFLVFLARRITGMPVGVLAAVRLGERSAVQPQLDLLSHEPSVGAVAVGPLGERSLGRLIDEAFGCAPDGPFARACHEVSGGNPFLAGELIRALVEEGAKPSEAWVARVREVGPTAVTQSVLLRLGRLPSAAVALAQALAVLGGGELRHAAALADLPLEAAGDASDALRDALILAAGEPLTFRHPLVRTAVYCDLRPARRATAHSHAARLLSDARAPLEQVAGHLLLTTPSGVQWVADTLQEAAGDALARGAAEPAVEYLRRALAEAPESDARPSILRTLGSARFMSGDPDGWELLREALDSTAEPDERAAILLELVPMLTVLEQLPVAVELLGRELRDGEDDDSSRAYLRAALTQSAAFDITTAEIVERELPPDVETMTGGTPIERHFLATAAYHGAIAGNTAAATVALAERALAGGLLITDQASDALRSMYAIQALLLADRYDIAEPAIEQLLGFARERESLHALDGASWLSSSLKQRRGRLQEAELSIRDALAAAAALGIAEPADVGTLVEILAEQGEIEQAAAELDGAGIDERWVAATTSPFALTFLRGRARLRIAQGDLKLGLEDALELGRRCERWGDLNPAQYPWRSDAALALLRLGDSARALRLARDELELARQFGAPRAIAVALRAVALATGGSECIELLQEAQEVLNGSAAALVRAEVLVDLGASLRRANQRAAARSPLATGLELATGCGARPLAARAGTELRAAGGRPRAHLRRGVDELTPSERRVCAMAAEGMSNPEIAQTLFVTRATVESHLHSAYRKLDINSRTGLAQALGDSSVDR
jgi:DNA-binding NarL/FixJ family response regulator